MRRGPPGGRRSSVRQSRTARLGLLHSLAGIIAPPPSFGASQASAPRCSAGSCRDHGRTLCSMSQRDTRARDADEVEAAVAEEEETDGGVGA